MKVLPLALCLLLLTACAPEQSYSPNPYALRQAADAAIQATEQARSEQVLAVTLEAARTQMALAAQSTQAALDTAATQHAQQTAERQATATAAAQANAAATEQARATATAQAASMQTAQARQAELERLRAERERREAEIALWIVPALKIALGLASLALALVVVWGTGALLRARYRLLQERIFRERVQANGDGVYTVLDPEHGEVHFAQPGRAYAPIVRVRRGIQAAAAPEPFQGRTTALDQMRALLAELARAQGGSLTPEQERTLQNLALDAPAADSVPQVVYLPPEAPEVRPILEEVRPQLLTLDEET